MAARGVRQALRGRRELLVGEEAACWCVLGLIPVLDPAVFPLIVAVGIVIVVVVGRRRGRGSCRAATLDAAAVRHVCREGGCKSWGNGVQRGVSHTMQY